MKSCLSQDPPGIMHSLRFKILATAAALVLLSQVGTVATVLVTARQDVADRARGPGPAGHHSHVAVGRDPAGWHPRHHHQHSPLEALSGR